MKSFNIRFGFMCGSRSASRDVEDLLAERGVVVSCETVRRRVNHFGPIIATDLRKRRSEAAFDLASRRGLSENRWPDGLSLARCRRRGRGPRCTRSIEAKRHAALKLIRKLLKKYAFALERMVTDDLGLCSSAARDLGLESRRERGRWKNNRAENSHQPSRRRERKMQRFKAPAPRRSLFQATPPSTTRSTSNVISLQPKRIAYFAPRRCVRRAKQSLPPDNP